MLDFRSIIENNVRLIGVQRGIILVIAFRRIETLQRDNLRHDLAWENFPRLELLNVRLRNVLLFAAV